MHDQICGKYGVRAVTATPSVLHCEEFPLRSSVSQEKGVRESNSFLLAVVMCRILLYWLKSGS